MCAKIRNPYNQVPHLTRIPNLFPILGVLGVIFNIFPNFNSTLCKQIVKILIRHRIMPCLVSDLGLHCLPMSHKKDARLIWVKARKHHFKPTYRI